MTKAAAFFAAILLTAPFVPAQNFRLNPAHVKGADSCKECHGSSVDAWQTTSHFKTFKELEGKAEDIADALDIDDVRTSGTCTQCHFTLQAKGNRVTAISGISCESCHGAAANWIEIHNKKGVPRAERIAESKAGGMIPPANIYLVGRNCFDCHIVDKEQLVDKGGHVPFSEGFDLLAWSQGEVRHNFQVAVAGSDMKESGNVNAEPSAERKRMLLMVGRILSMEYSLRALASAKVAGKFAKAHNGRFLKLRGELEQLSKVITTDELTRIVEIANGVGRNNMVQSADAISKLAEEFAEKHDGSAFGKLDPVIAQIQPKGKAYNP